jgi:hypothetical protein
MLRLFVWNCRPQNGINARPYLKATFKRLALDGDGFVPKPEFRKSGQLGSAMCKALFEVADTDGGSHISLAELLLELSLLMQEVETLRSDTGRAAARYPPPTWD